MLLGLFSNLLMGCSVKAEAKSDIHKFLVSSKPLVVGTNLTTPIIPITNTPMIITPIFSNTPTYRPSATMTTLPTDTPIPTKALTNTWNPAGEVTAPILLYHHISDHDPENRYFVTLENFRTQLQALHDWGCTTITASGLAEVIVHGGELPTRPIVISFDDGYQDVFHNAFPFMQEMGFIGVIYIYFEQIGLNGYVSMEQIKTLANNGWEIGSHSMSHEDLTRNHSDLAYEVQESRSKLQETIGVKVDTFAYPYGKSDEEVIKFVKDSNYLAGMGLGLNWHHTMDSLFDLNRVEIRGDLDILSFKSLLPWIDD
jgi:peptidoglycan/xylan/chitin deacetylase (PgdA/CDA1 family)